MVTLGLQNIFCACTWSSNWSGGGAILALASFLNQIRHQKEPEILVGIFSLNMKITVSNCWVLLDPKGGKQFSGPLEGMSTHRIAVSHMIRIVNVTHVLAVPFHNVRFHWVSFFLLLLLLFLFKLVFNIASLSTWFQVGVSNQNFTDGFLLEFDFFPAVAQQLQWSAILRFLSMMGHNCRNLMPWRYELLLQWQQNRSKATMWLLYKFPAIWGYPRRF